MDRLTAAVRLLAGDKEPVRLASTANLALAGLLTVDGVVTVAGDRVLVKDQTDATENGIYTASEGTWRRAPDCASSRTMIAEMKVAVQEGAAHAGDVWSLATNRPDIGDDDIEWVFYLSSDTVASINQAAIDFAATADDILAAALAATNAADFPSRAAAALFNIPAGLTYVRTAGYLAAGDGGEALYKKVVSQPAHPGKFQSADGAWWEIAELELNFRQFGAKGDNATNDTASINDCYEAAYQLGLAVFMTAGYFRVDEASPGAGYAILNKGVSWRGAPRQASVIVPLSTMADTVDYFFIQLQSGGDIGFIEISHFLIWCGIDGTIRGKRGIYMLDNVVANISRLHLHDVYVTPGNDYSLHIENNPAFNPQGCPSNSVIERCGFWQGTHMTYIGDSVTMRNNILRSTGSRVGCLAYLTDALGTASLFVFEQNNVDCAGGALQLLNGGRPRVLNNNIELSAGAGTSNGTVIDIDGSSGTIPFAEVCGNHVGIFGTATATSAIRVNGTLGAKVDHNTLLAGITVGTGIVVTSSATDAILGYHEISSGFTTKISDAGAGTRGVLKALTLVNSFANVGSGYDDAACKKDSHGTVHLVGFLNCPANPANLGIATLPVGFRPVTTMRFHVWGLVAAADAQSTVEIDTSGNITFRGANTFDQLLLSGISFPTTNYVVASL